MRSRILSPGICKHVYACEMLKDESKGKENKQIPD